MKTGVAELAQARDEAGAKSVIDKVYEGASASSDEHDAVSVTEGPSFSGTLATLAPSRTQGASGKSLAELEASSHDRSLPFAERASAVQAIAGLKTDEAKAVLRAFGRADPEAGAVDYEVSRKALQALAGLGEVTSLPPVSARHAAEILKSLSKDKPAAAVFDYDDTLERNQRQASARTAAALKAVSDAGVRTMILTARSDRPDDIVGKTVLESLSTLSPEQKAGLVLGASRGARVLVFDRKGSARLVSVEPTWTEAERRGIAEAGRIVKARYGEALVERVGELTDYSFSLFLPVGTSPEEVGAAAALLEMELSKRGIKPAAVSGRVARNPSRPSFVVVSKYDKSLGIGLLMGSLDHWTRLRKIVRRLPKALWGLAVRLSERVSSAPVPGDRILMVGDHFFGSRVEDLNMTKAAPGGLSLAVGGTADPRVERVFVWPSHGHAATQEIMGALASSSPAD